MMMVALLMMILYLAWLKQAKDDVKMMVVLFMDTFIDQFWLTLCARKFS